MDYPGKVITKNQVTPTQTSATGVWTLDDAAAATRNNNWPVAGVPNPISKSLRFNSADSAYLNRTPASASNRKTWTWSGWVKRTTINNTGQNLFSTDNGSSTTFGQLFFSDNILEFNCYASSAYQWRLITTQVWRDLSAWYHIVAVLDTTQATSSNRVKLYVNGIQITAFTTATYPSLNFDGAYNLNQPHYIGAAITSSGYLNGYQTEINFIDGQALTPSSFGMTDPITGVWEPLKYSGTYGTNGFYLNFKDATSTTTLGLDYSGNSNTWTTNNFSVTAGAGNDSLTDVPTPWIPYNTTGDVGGVFRGNYCTLNPLDEPSTYAAAGTPVNGNLDFSVSNDSAAGATFAVSSGKWYWEMTVVSGHTAGSNTVWAAIASSTPSSVNKLPNQSGSGGRAYATTGSKFNENTSSSYGNTYTNGDVIGCALDLDNGKVYWSKNGTFQASGDPVAGTNAAFTGLTGTWLPVAFSNAPLTSFNFGQRPFAYTPPSGFLSLCTTNLPASTVLKGSEYFNAVTYAGSASQQTIDSNLSILDVAWIKNRTTARDHVLVDTVRGGSPMLTLYPNATYADDNTSPNYNPTSISGSSIVLGGAKLGINNSGENFVLWGWNAGGSTVTNTSGTISAQVRASTTSGFSIVTYTGTGSNATVGHGLGVVPSMVIVKRRNGGSTENWMVYHVGITTPNANPGNNRVLLNLTNASNFDSSIWNNTNPTSTVFSIGTSSEVNANTGTYVAYCFAPISGFSAFGSYTGNGSTDGPFVYLGFRPRFVLIKNITTGGAGYDWFIHDTARDTYNVCTLDLEANLALSENQYGAEQDIVSNGFKLRNSGAGTNGSSNTYIYAAFAENPFKNALAR